MPINIAHRSVYPAALLSVSSESAPNCATNLVSESGVWKPRKGNSSFDFVILDFSCEVNANFIEISAQENFPQNFRIEISSDNDAWQILQTENGFILNDENYTLHFPLKTFRYIKLFIHYNDSAGEVPVIKNITAGISGITTVEVNDTYQKENSLANLFDGSDSPFSASCTKPERLEMVVDLNTVSPVTAIGLKPSADLATCPSQLIVEVSADKRIWSAVIDQRHFFPDSDKLFLWNFNSIPARYLRFEISPVELKKGNFFISIHDIEIHALPEGLNHSHTFSEGPSYASVFQPGLVRFAKDGEDSRDAAIRASDRRLRDATTFFKGIVQFAEDGQATPNTAILASDSRLKPATELSAGIVQLAYDYEIKPGTVVQASDPRLKDASEKSSGIVKLCPDGAYSELGVVRGNDSRLKNATESAFGIVRLAKNGESEGSSVVQANDSRLRDASEISKGIVAFSADGEEAEGKAVQANDRRLKNATTKSKGIVELAEDGEDSPLTAVQGNDKRLKNASTESRGIVELAENNEIKAGAVVQSNDDRLRDASTSYKGIVRLAEDGEESPLAAVQGNDKRLKSATTVAEGIVELAEDGEVAESKVVQSNDKRLRNATTTYKGIVEMAEDGEIAAERVVQSDDRRLKDATTKTTGIVQFSENGESSPLKAVQSNDDRLRKSSEDYPGIVQLAKNGENSPFKCVQSNDHRLRDGSEEQKGIVQFAHNGEISPLKAVQSDDQRIQPAGTVTAGIVRLAKDGESTEGAVVQSNDSRLHDGSEDEKGIVRFAKHGESRAQFAVQSSDPRLSDAREPLNHEHNYAQKNHNYNEHSGTLSISGEKAEVFGGLTPPSDNSVIIYGKNASSEAGAIGVSGVALPSKSKKNEFSGYGVVGHSDFVGIRGQATGHEKNPRGAGVLGISRNAPGGVFISEHDYSLLVDGYASIDDIDPSLKMVGNGKALQVKGESHFHGVIHIDNDKDNDATTNIVEMFELENDDFISHGDVVIASEKGASLLKRTHKAYDRTVIGIIAGKPALSINNSGKETKLYPIALAGKVMCKVDARTQPIAPGDLLVTSDTPGCAMKGTIDSFEKVGSVIGKALDSLESGTGVIAVFLTHQ
ncbi:MAG: hypothetical protein JXK07_05765 [Spirochaetes bacterium]|nr:hypothetical protein [Spirochaetota bacterium]MBN2771732.1 hypothetical protein [Spirochaetota bacterium]